MNSTYAIILIFVVISHCLTGCVVTPVKAWERGSLAERQMQLVPDELEAALEEHTYFSKEAATGGTGVGGGGCGCN